MTKEMFQIRSFCFSISQPHIPRKHSYALVMRRANVTTYAASISSLNSYSSSSTPGRDPPGLFLNPVMTIRVGDFLNHSPPKGFPQNQHFSRNSGTIPNLFFFIFIVVIDYSSFLCQVLVGDRVSLWRD